MRLKKIRWMKKKCGDVRFCDKDAKVLKFGEKNDLAETLGSGGKDKAQW